MRWPGKFFFASLVVAMVWGAAASADLFAQARTIHFPKANIETIEEQSLAGEDLVLSPRAASAPEGRSDGSWFPKEDSAAEPAGGSPSGYREVTVIYDTDRNRDNIFSSGGANTALAQRYDVPPEARLASVLFAPLYSNDLIGSSVPVSAPRDFTLKIWDVSAGGSPGDELYSMDVDEAPDARHIVRGLAYRFLQVDLPAEDEALSNLPDSIFIGFSNKGTDRNYIGLSTSPRRDASPEYDAYVNTASGWLSFSRIVLGSEEIPLSDQVLPIRPAFLVPLDSELEETILSYDTGYNEKSIYVQAAAGDIMAQRYDVPPEARLASVSVAPAYNNEFSNSAVSIGAPRDFTLKIWDASAGDGLPGDELYSQDVEEGPYASHRLSGDRYWFLHIDLPEEEEILSALPDRIFVGLANKGSDNNYLIQTVAGRQSDAPENVAYIYTHASGAIAARWYSISAITVEGESLGDQVFPIRPRFLAASEVVSAEDAAELPSGVELAQNYPNPFNPATSISWTQSNAERVRLSVYNLLGQQVAVPADGLYAAGEHEVRLDATGWPSGVYAYVLQTETRMLTRHMALVK